MAPEDVTSLLSAQAGRATSTIAIPGATTLDDTTDDERLALFGCDSHGEHFGIGRDKVGRRESVDELARIEIDLRAELSKASILPRRDSSLLSGLGSRRRSKLARSPSAKSSTRNSTISERAERRVRQPDNQGHHRGRPHGLLDAGFNRQTPDHHRGHGRRNTEERARNSINAGRRDGILIPQHIAAKTRSGKSPGLLLLLYQPLRCLAALSNSFAKDHSMTNSTRSLTAGRPLP